MKIKTLWKRLGILGKIYFIIDYPLRFIDAVLFFPLIAWEINKFWTKKLFIKNG